MQFPTSPHTVRQITDVVARELKAMVVEPEHRFYGTSLPLGASSFDLGVMRRLFTPQQVRMTDNTICD